MGTANSADFAKKRLIGNRRVTIRYRCAPATAGKICGTDDREFQRAWIENLSRTGVGLYLSKPVPDGCPIVVQLVSTLDKNIREFNGQVMHSTLREPYGWFIGIEFFEHLDEDTLDSLL